MLGFVTALPKIRLDGHSEANTFTSGWPLLKRLRRQVAMPVFRIVDSGAFGLTPLRQHILICGFPRSGTTLLQLMLENALPHARRFGREVGGWRAATYSWRNHSHVVSKVPHDVFRLSPLRDFYSRRDAELKIILMLRDPRDVLTSCRKSGGPKGYVVTAERWRRYHQAFCRHQNDPDVITVRYEDLIGDVERQQQRIETFTGQKMAVRFDEFNKVERPDFDCSTLNGLRPIENSQIARWAQPQHRDRIWQVLSELPELTQSLVDLGYAADTKWIDEKWAQNPDRGWP